MIVPYYNNLAIFLEPSQKINQKNQEIITQFFEQYFSQNKSSQAQILIGINYKNFQASSKKQFSILIDHIISNLKGQKMYKINNTFTNRNDIFLLYQALKNIKLVQSANPKGPLQIQNIEQLKNYFLLYKSQSELNCFVKQLLIQAIDPSKKVIKYRSLHQACQHIQDIKAKMKGHVEIMQIQKQEQLLNMNINVFLSSTCKKQYCQQKNIISFFETISCVDKSINQHITNSLTLQKLKNNQLKKFARFVKTMQAHLNKKVIQEIKFFSINLKIIANLRKILDFGIKLALQQEQLNMQFMAYIMQMTQKNNKEVKKYLQAFSTFIAYSRKKQKMQFLKRNTNLIQQYSIGFHEQIKIDQKKIKIQSYYCSIIQKRIRSFLLRKNIQNQYMKSYFNLKNQKIRKNQQNYELICDSWNLSQQAKFKTFNKHKYGFSCYLHLIQISNPACYVQFDPQHIKMFFYRIHLSRQPVCKIKVDQYTIQVTTLQGTVFRLGQFQNNQNQNLYISNKQNMKNSSNLNIKPSNNNPYKSLSSFKNNINSNQNSINSKDLNTFSKHKCIDLTQKNLRTKTSKKHSKLIFGDDCQFLIDQQNKLYGKGCNKFGQLGLEACHAYVQNFTLILKDQKVDQVVSQFGHTIVISQKNKIYHFGKQRKNAPQSFIPIQIFMQQKFKVKQVVIGCKQTYFLADNDKIYNYSEQEYIRLPKECEIQLQNFYLIKTASSNIEISYLIGYNFQTLDRFKAQEIKKYLTQQNFKQKNQQFQSFLLDKTDFQEGYDFN